ncbi:MAG: cell division protein SepF [Clostridia bacterium]|nr:cell division protein SepF [Clostridia bacterium]
MGSFDEKYGFNRTFGEETYDFYEDTHDENGQYSKKLREFTVANNNANGLNGREDTFTPRPNNIVNSNVNTAPSPSLTNNAPQTDTAVREERVEEKKKVISFKNVMVYEPQVEKEAQAIINCLKTNEPIILKMDETDADVAQRIIDFVAGAIYAMDGLIKKISTAVFLAVPPSVKVIIPEGEDNNG